MNNDTIVIVAADTSHGASYYRALTEMVGRMGKTTLFLSLEEYDNHPKDNIDFFLLDELVATPVCYDEPIKQSDFKFRKKEYWQKGRW